MTSLYLYRPLRTEAQAWADRAARLHAEWAAVRKAIRRDFPHLLDYIGPQEDIVPPARLTTLREAAEAFVSARNAADEWRIAS